MSDSLFNHPLTLLVVVGLPLLGIVAKFAGQSFQRIAKWYLYVSVFAVVVVMDSIFFPFIGGKDWFFRFAIELALIASVLWWAFEAKSGEVSKLVRDAFKRPTVVAVTVFVLAIVLASLFAFDIHAAFWSNYERGEGAFQMLHYGVFFLLLVMLLKEEGDWRRLFGFSVTAACLMVGYGLLANLGTATLIGPYAGGPAPDTFFGKILAGRFQGTLGNPAYVAPYLMFALFFAAQLWINKKEKSGSAARHWGYGILCAIFVFVFLLSQTRGAFIGLGVGVLAFFIYTAFSKNRLLRKISLAIILILLVGGGLILSVRNAPWVENIPGGRLLQISFSDSTAQTRFWVWGEAWHGFLERPVFGWGSENFTTVFDKYFNPNFYQPNVATETWFDRAHGVFFDYLVEAGLLGVLAYLGVFVTFFAGFFKSRRRRGVDGTDRGAARDIERGLLVALPVAYLVQGVAIFDVLPMYIPLFMFLAFAGYYFQNTKNI